MKLFKDFRPFRIYFGVCLILDGFLTVLTLGYVYSSFALNAARNNAKRKILTKGNNHE